MLRWFLKKMIDKGERQLGASMEYLRRMLKTSPGAVLRVGLLGVMSAGKVDPRYQAISGIIGTQAEDCGACLQIAIKQAKDHGVDPALIKRIVRGETLDGPLELVARLCRAVVEQDPASVELSEEVGRTLGEAALIEISLNLAASRAYPTIKRSMGMAYACSVLDLEAA